jgi:hypothetical protein
MSNKEAGKSSKKLGRAARQAVHNKGLRLHRIVHARDRHIKNAIRSCGLKFAEELRKYYISRPTASLGCRAGRHRGTRE